MTDKTSLVKLGFVANPHGIRGEAERRLFNTEDSVLEDGMKVFLFPSSQKSKISPAGEEWLIKKVRFGNKVICQFDGVRDRTHLESLIPFEIFLDRDTFPEPEDGEVYLIDLIGMDVINESGEVIGTLESFSDNGMQYLFDVRLAPNGEMLTLPYVDAFFPSIDVENRRITIILPEFTE